jgi:hypothetical protein
VNADDHRNTKDVYLFAAIRRDVNGIHYNQFSLARCRLARQ